MSDEQRRNSKTGKSPLQALKDLPLEEREFLLQQRKDGVMVEDLLGQIAARHGIHGLNAKRWSDFAKWHRQRAFWSEASESITDLRSSFADHMPEATPSAVHEYLLDLVKSVMAASEDPELQASLLKFVVVETRKVMELRDSRERWLEEQRTKVDAGLDAVFQDIKGNPEAVALYEKIAEIIRPKEKA